MRGLRVGTQAQTMVTCASIVDQMRMLVVSSVEFVLVR